MLVKFLQQKFQRKESGTQYRTFAQLLHLDFLLLFGIFTLVIFGFFILYSASNQQFSTVSQEIMHIALAMLVMFVVAQIPPRFFQKWSVWLYAVGIILLIIVLTIGRIEKGAQRWLNLGLLRFQPSELMKIAIPMILAWYYSYRDLPPRFKDLIISTGIIIVPVLLTAKEPDLGTAIILLFGGLCILLFAGIRWRYIVSSIALLLVFVPILWHHLHDYQRQRILTFLNPERDPLGAGYHTIQAKIAIGSGGIFGKGWLQGTQAHLHFLPEHATDFIFAVCGEEFGLIGCSLLLLLYLYITLCCVRIANQAQDTYTRLLAASLALMFFISVFVNIGMVTGLLPVVGLPLPLISYGGSSMLTLMTSFGILMSIHGHKKLLSK